MVSVQFSGQSFERLVPGGLSTGKFVNSRSAIS